MALKTFTKTKYLGSVSASGTSVTGTLKLIVTENSTDISNNRSNCTATLQLIIEPAGYSWRASSGSYSLSGDVSTSGNIASMTYYNGTTTLVTKDFKKNHNNDGTGSISVGFSFSSSNVYGGSETLTGTLTNIPRKAEILTAEDFTDEGNPTITYENKAGTSVTTLQACIASQDGNTVYVPYRDIDKEDTSYQFNLTSEEREDLRELIPNDNSLQVKFYIKTVISGNTYYSSLKKTMTLVNANPTFSNFTFADTNSTTTALTGNNQYCVLGYSNIQATVSTTNKATANKSATMSKYRFTIGEASTDITYSSSASVDGTINNASSGTFTLYAIDSRNNSTPVTKLATVVKEYQNIYINRQETKIARNNNGTGTSAQLTLKGTLWNNSFGSVTNSIQSITYQYKKTTSSTWVTGATSITATASGNNYSFTGYIAGDGGSGEWDASDSYNVRITITDRLSTDTVDIILNSGEPTMALAKTGMAIMGMYDTSLGGALQIAKKKFEDYLWADGITSVADCNDMLKDGAYGWSGSTSNTPVANSWGTLLVINNWTIEGNNNNTTVQLAFISDSNNEKVFFRERYGQNGWSSWKALYGGSKARAFIDFEKTSNFTTSSTSAVDVPSASTTVTTYGGDILVTVSMTMGVTGNMAFVHVYVDNTDKGEILYLSATQGIQNITGTLNITGVSAGSHTFKLKTWVQKSTNVGTIYSYNMQQMTITEL